MVLMVEGNSFIEIKNFLFMNLDKLFTFYSPLSGPFNVS